jgi:hypothetical protein
MSFVSLAGEKKEKDHISLYTDYQDKMVSNTRFAKAQEFHLQGTRVNVGRQTTLQGVTYV